jgi:urea transport system ATP-binding protein
MIVRDGGTGSIPAARAAAAEDGVREPLPAGMRPAGRTPRAASSCISTASRSASTASGAQRCRWCSSRRDARIIGPNGAGKTTMMDVITGKTRPDTGDVWFGGRRSDAARRAGIAEARHRPQVPEADGVRAPHRVRQSGAGAGRRPPARPAGWARRDAGAERERIEQVLEIVRLTERRDAPAALSHGQKQWLEIGMLLIQEPQLLLVDEPVAGMTTQEPSDRRTAARAQPAAFGGRGRARHGIRARSRVKVTVLHEGSVLAEGSIDEVQSNPRVESVPRRMSMLKIKGLNQFTAAVTYCAGTSPDVPKPAPAPA